MPWGVEQILKVIWVGKREVWHAMRNQFDLFPGRMELYEAKWTEVPDTGDTVNLDFVRNVVGKSRVAAGAVISRTPNSFPLSHQFRALPITELG